MSVPIQDDAKLWSFRFSFFLGQHITHRQSVDFVQELQRRTSCIMVEQRNKWMDHVCWHGRCQRYVPPSTSSMNSLPTFPLLPQIAEIA